MGYILEKEPNETSQGPLESAPNLIGDSKSVSRGQSHYMNRKQVQIGTP